MDLLIADGTVAEDNRDMPPTTGTGGWATDGNPAASIPATDWPAWAWNMLCAEIRQVLIDNGIAPNVHDWQQLSAAIKKYAPLISPKFTQSLTVDGEAGSTRQIALSSGGVARMVISVDNSAENGGDSGSNISIVVCGDDGKLKFQPIGINRSTGEININTPMTVSVPELNDDSAKAVSSGWIRDLLGQINWVEVLSSTALLRPAWATRIEIMAEGPGGGGSNCKSTGSNSPFSGAGGGSGARVHGIYPVGLNDKINVLIGEGGAPQSLGGDTIVHRANANGSVDLLLTAGGGQGTYFTDSLISPGGNGGTASGGTIENRNGQPGGDGQNGTLWFSGYGGGIGGGRAGAQGGTDGTSPGSGGGGAYDPTASGKTYLGGRGCQGRVQYRWLP